MLTLLKQNELFADDGNSTTVQPFSRLQMLQTVVAGPTLVNLYLDYFAGLCGSESLTVTFIFEVFKHV